MMIGVDYGDEVVHVLTDREILTMVITKTLTKYIRELLFLFTIFSLRTSRKVRAKLLLATLLLTLRITRDNYYIPRQFNIRK